MTLQPHSPGYSTNHYPMEFSRPAGRTPISSLFISQVLETLSLTTEAYLYFQFCLRCWRNVSFLEFIIQDRDRKLSCEPKICSQFPEEKELRSYEAWRCFCPGWFWLHRDVQAQDSDFWWCHSFTAIYKNPPKQYQDFKDHIQKLAEVILVKESQSSHSSPPVVIERKTGSWHIVLTTASWMQRLGKMPCPYQE